MGKYEQAYAEFIAKYDLNLNIQTEYDGANRISSIDDFSMDTSPARKAQNVYISTLSSALTDYISKKVKIEPGKNYDLANIDVGGFIAEFDKVIDAIRSDEAEKENTEYTHRKFEGLPFDRVANEAWARVAPRFNKPLHEIWAGQIRNGSLSLEQLQRITNSSTRLLDGMVGSIGYNSAANKDLADVVMIKNAMAEAINKRSWTSWLNPFNWGPNMRENAYLKELDGKINTYRENNFPVDSVVPAIYSGNMLEGAQSNLTTYIADYKKANPTSVREPVSKKAPAPQKAPEPEKIPVVDKNAPISQQIDQIRSNFALLDPHYKAIGDIVTKYTNRDAEQIEGVIRMAIFGELRNMQIENAFLESENQGVADDSSIQKGVREMAVGVFKDLYEKLPIMLNIPQGNHSSIAVVQEVTNYLMKNFSPVLQNPEKYGKYADNYVVKVDSYLTEITKEAPGSWTFTAALDLLKIKPEEVMQEPEQIISEVKKEEPKAEEINEEANNNNGSEIENIEEVNPRTAIFNELTERINQNLEDYVDIISDGVISDNNKFMKKLNRAHIVGSKFNALEETIRKYNEQFANLEISDTETMREMAKAVFAESYKLVKKCKVSDSNYILATQKMANYIMEVMSPAALDEEKYGEYADNYVLKDYDLLTDALGDEVLDIRSQLENAREELKIELDEDILKEEREKFENLESKKENAEAEAQSNENDEPEADEESVVEYEEVDQYFLNDYFEEDDGIVDFLSTYSTLVKDKSGISSADLYEMLNDNLESFGGKIKNYNKLFNESLKGEVKLNNRKVSSEEIMQEMTLDVFKGLYGNIAKLAGKNNITAAIIATQLLTDYILDGCSPAKENESLEKYVNNYLLKNEDILTKAMGVKKINPDVLHDARKKLNAFPKVEKQEDISNEVEDEIEVQNEVEESKVDYNPVDLDEMEEKFGDEDELEDFLWDVAREISISEDVNEKDVLQNSDLIEKIRGYNQLFNKALKEDIKIDGRKISCDDIIRKMTMDIFKTIYGEVIKAAGDSNWDRIRDAQCATDTVLELMSPLKTNRDAFEKYADNYLIKNESILAKAMGVEKVDPDILQDVRNDRKAFPDGKEEVDNLGDILPKADGPVRENLGLKLEDLENSALVNNVNDRVSSAPEKKLNNLAK